MTDYRVAKYEPDGQVLRLYLDSIRAGNLLNGIVGPVGSGKTMASQYGCFVRGWQAPIHPKWGDRRYRHLTVRDTYPNLATTTLESWDKLLGTMFGKGRLDFGTWSGGTNTVGRHEFPMDVIVDGTTRRIHFDLEFRAIGDKSVEGALRGWEGQDAYLNEVDLQPAEIMDFLLGRVGRDPGTYPGLIWADFNAPPFGNWTLDYWYGEVPDGRRLFIQPGGMDADAENLKFLPGGREYYARQIANMADPMKAERLVHNRPGTSHDGQRVYPEFRGDLHLVGGAGIDPIDAPLILGADQGLQPAVVICQDDSHGQRRVLGELVGENVLVDQFADQLRQMLGSDRYRGLQVGAAYVDPAGGARSANQSDEERTWTRVMSSATGIRFRPASSNATGVRIAAVKRYLTRNTFSGPGLRVSQRHCPKLSVGFMASYRYRTVALSGHERRLADQPEKNAVSHPHDALQYACLGGSGLTEADDRRRRQPRRTYSTAPAGGGFDVMRV